MNPKLTPERLSRKAVVYVRQSKPSQLIHNQESTRLQLSLADRAVNCKFRFLSGSVGHQAGNWKKIPTIACSKLLSWCFVK